MGFVGGDRGVWHVERIATMTGEGLAHVEQLDLVEGRSAADVRGTWVLRGVTSNDRYVERDERDVLVARQPPLGRMEATRAALIPIRKSPVWWDLTQDERRAIFETRSHHIATGLEYLPAIARRLHHGRDLGEEFDFLTWFEFAPADAGAFEELVARLRQTEEWAYVEREVDIRMSRA
jgi:chlorite dismutase